MPTQIYGSPGWYAGRTITPINIYTNPATARYGPSFYFFDGNLARDPDDNPTTLLRAGLLCGKVTTSAEGGGYANSVIGVTTANYTSGGLSLTVTPQCATEIVRRIGTSGTFNTVGGTTATAAATVTLTTYSAVNTTTGVITVSSLGVNVAAGAAIMPTDGSQNVNTIYDNEYGTDVTDVLNNNIDQPIHRFVIGGDFFSALIINLTVVNAGTEAYLKAQLRANSGGVFTFDDDR